MPSYTNHDIQAKMQAEIHAAAKRPDVPEGYVSEEVRRLDKNIEDMECRLTSLEERLGGVALHRGCGVDEQGPGNPEPMRSPLAEGLHYANDRIDRICQRISALTSSVDL